jgi:hypothetical protein
MGIALSPPGADGHVAGLTVRLTPSVGMSVVGAPVGERARRMGSGPIRRLCIVSPTKEWG